MVMMRIMLGAEHERVGVSLYTEILVRHDPVFQMSMAREGDSVSGYVLEWEAR